MLYVIGLGLADEKDISVNGLEAIKNSERIYLECYTSILLVDVDRLEKLYGKKVIIADRDMVETESDQILEDSNNVNISFLVVGDPYGATTHTDLLLRARQQGIKFKVYHNASIMNAAGASGLQLYNFGQTVSVPFFTETWRPSSFVERIAENMRIGCHTLVLLDIKVKEQSEENLARGKKIFEPPRFMSVKVAVDQLLSIDEENRKEAYDENTLAISLSRVGADEQVIKSGTLKELSELSEEDYGKPLHSLILVGKRLHELEAEYAQEFAIGDGWNIQSKKLIK